MAPLTFTLTTLLTAGSLLTAHPATPPKCGGLVMPGYGNLPVVLVDGRVHDGPLADVDAMDVHSIEVGCWSPVHGFDVPPGVPVVRVLTKSFAAEHDAESTALSRKADERGLHAMRALWRSRQAGDRLAETIPTPACLERESNPLRSPFGFRSGSVVLSGELLLPRAEPPFPAVVLLPGGGSDPELLRSAPAFMAEEFARCGFAALAFDKRGTGDSEGSYQDSTFDDFVADADAAVRALRNVEAVDPEGVGVMGFSQGGRLAPLVAVRNPSVAFVVSLSGPIAPVRDTRMHALHRTYARAGVAETTLNRIMPLWGDHLGAIAAGDSASLAAAEPLLDDWRAQLDPRLLPPPPDELPRTAIYNSMGRDYHSDLDRLEAPWLSLYGEDDPVVPVEASVKIIHDEMFEGGHDGYAVVVIPEADHSLTRAADGERVRFEDLVVDWVQRRLRARAQEGVPAEVRTAEVRTLRLTSDGRMGFGVTGHGLGVLEDGRFRWVRGEGTPPQRGVADIHEDVTGRIWAVGPGGAHVLDDDGWAAVSWMGGLEPTVVFGVSNDARRRMVWLATNRGAARVQEDRWATYTPEDGLPHAVVHDVVTDGKGEAWFLTRTGVARRAGEGRLEVHREDLNFHSAVVDADGVVWFGTNDGVHRYLDGEWVGELDGVVAYPKLVTADGSIWAGSFKSGVFRRHRGEWHSVALPKRVRGWEVYDLTEAADGSIWVATAAGVVRIPRDAVE